MTRLLFLFIMPAVLCCQKAVRAQPELPPVFHLTERDGLDPRYAMGLVEDRKRDLIWIGSQGGIWRYDGEVLVKVYPRQVPNQLSADSYLAINILLADSRGDIWFYDRGNSIKRLSHSTGEVRAFFVDPVQEAKLPKSKNQFIVFMMIEDRKGRIWANTPTHGLLLFDEKKACFVPAKMLQALKNIGNFGKILEDEEGWIWLSNANKPCRYNPETGEVWSSKYNPNNWPIFDLFSQIFFIDSRHKMWLAEPSNGYMYDLGTHQFQRREEIVGASSFVEDSLGRVWFGRFYNNRLTCFDAQSGQFIEYLPDNNNPNALHIGQWISWLHLDKRGMLWAFDIENVNLFNPVRKQAFQVFKKDLSKGEKSLPLGQVSDVFSASDGRYYVSYWTKNGGVVVLDSNFQVEEKWYWSKQEFDNHRNAFWNSVEDNEGNIWMARQKGWFLIYNIKRRSLRTIYCPEMKDSAPHRAMKDSQGNLWWGLWRVKGITKWDCRTRKFTNYQLTPNNYGMVYNMVEDGPDLLWLATEQGIIKFDRSTGKCLGNYLPPAHDTTHRLRTMAIGFVKTNDSTLVGGCLSGIYEFNLKTHQFKLLQFNNSTKVPLAIADMVSDAAGNIYYGNLGHMVRFSPRSKKLTVIPLTETIGFPFVPRFYQNTLPNRRLAFAANDRFIILDIAALEKEVPVPVPKLTLFMVDGDTTALGRNLEKPIRLQHNENYFSLHFSSFAHPDQAIYYSYRLKGLKEEWSQPSPTPNARFTNVPPGEYTFELRAQLANGTPTEVSAFPFEILPPFWQIWWFRLLAVAAVAVLIRLIFRYRLRQQLEKEAIRLRIARDLHDEVGSTLTTISILSESVLRQMELDGEKARLSGIGDKARTAMSSMSDIVWSVNPQNDSMDKIVERMIRFATDTLEPLGISAIFDIEKEVFALQVPMEQRKDFYLFFKEATTNVAKHSGATRAVFSIKKTGRQLLFTIEDDGKGLAPQPQGSLGGNGLRNMRARAEALGAEFEVGNHSGPGASVSLKIPLR